MDSFDDTIGKTLYVFIGLYAVFACTIAAGVVYNLSRRTAVYGTYAQMDNKGTGTGFATGSVATTQAGGKTQGLDLGVRHSF